MSRCKLATLITLAALPVCSTSFAEMKPDTHSGFFIGLGVGGGCLTPEFNNTIEFDAETGGFGNFYLGLALSQSVLIGFDASSWARDFDVDAFGTYGRWTFNNFALCLWLYPTDYFFLKAGPAIASAEIKMDAFGFDFTGSKTGLGFTIGAGGELRLTRKFAIVPQETFMYQSFDDSDFTTVTFALTVGVGWYW